jgi:hypothetical protein
MGGGGGVCRIDLGRRQTAEIDQYTHTDPKSLLATMRRSSSSTAPSDITTGAAAAAAVAAASPSRTTPLIQEVQPPARRVQIQIESDSEEEQEELSSGGLRRGFLLG